MRQVESKSWLIGSLSIVLAVVSLIAAGCRDNPQDKAAKAVHKQIQAALSQPDASTAQQQVQSALSIHRPTGLAQDSAQLVNGNLIFSQGLVLLAELPLKTLPVRSAAEEISSRLIQAQQLLLEKDRIEKMLALQDTEMAELKALISGTSAQPGLQARLSKAQAELAELARQKQVLEKDKNSVQAVIDEYKARSESLLKQADIAKGDEKLGLQQQAYNLQLERKDDYVKVQTAENQISVLDDQIVLVQAQIKSLEDNLLQTQTQIDTLETAEHGQMLRSQRSDIDQQLSSQQKKIYEQADIIKTAQDAYRQAANDASQTFEKAAEQYQRIRRSAATMPAAVRQADSCTYAALACAEQMLFLKGTAAQLTGIVNSADETFVRGLAERLPLNADIDPEQFQKMMDLFDRADKSYEEAMNLARQIPVRGREAAASVLNSHLLAIHSKMQVADALAHYDIASQTQTRLEELKKIGEDFGSLFTLSETAQLLEKGLAYIPSLPVNVELYFEGIRQRFGEWKRLGTPAEQAAAVEQNFVEMEALIQTYGDEMSRLLDPLKQEMLTAKERGFTASVTQTPGANEPNSIR